MQIIVPASTREMNSEKAFLDSTNTSRSLTKSQLTGQCDTNVIIPPSKKTTESYAFKPDKIHDNILLNSMIGKPL